MVGKANAYAILSEGDPESADSNADERTSGSDSGVRLCSYGITIYK